MDLLLVEDKDSFRKMLVQSLEGSAWSVWAVPDPQQALDMLARQPFQVMVTDLRLPGQSGLDVIRRAKRLQPALRVVLMSAFGEPRDIVEAMRLGADDFLPKPFDLDAFHGLLDRLRALVGAPPPDPAEAWVAHSAPQRDLETALRRAADSEAPVLFTGPKGAGKARAARFLHALRHPKAPYLSLAAASLDAGAVSEPTLRLLEGGSLHLADLEDLSAEAAKVLVQAMESPAGRKVRWMGGTTRPEAVAEAVRHRLGVLELPVAPLSERKEDLLPLLRAFLERGAAQEGRIVPILDRPAERQILAHHWPGNVRELEMLARRTLLFAGSTLIRRFPDLGLGESAPLCLPWPEPGPLDAMQKAVALAAEAQLLRRALERAEGRPAAAAEALGVTLRSLALRLREHGIPLEE